MNGNRLEVADIVRGYAPAYLAKYDTTSLQHRRVLQAITDCRTAALGGHKSRCDVCGHEQIAYNSCRDRNCPKCQGSARAEWLSAREAELLPGVAYFHVVFTLPHELGTLALQNRRVVYSLFFRAVSETLREIGRDPKHLGAEIGFFAILHTWGQKLDHHAHIHCVVPGGGISLDRSRWIAASKTFFLPVRVLSRRFRTRLLGYLREAREDGDLCFQATLRPLAVDSNWYHFLRVVEGKKWVVYAKPPFAGPVPVLKYLARYTHRVAISNSRLHALHDGQVTFQWKDYAHGYKTRLLTLDAVEFIRRFLLHVLPKGFVHIRHYGFLANRVRDKRLALCRELLAVTASESDPPNHANGEPHEQSSDDDSDRVCPACGKGRLRVVECILPVATQIDRCCYFQAFDTS